jgi:predicted ATP-binding protein involved in virulence
LSQTPSVPLRIDRLVLNNFRRFAGLCLDLEPDLTVLVADNGKGKTAVLDALALALGPFVGGFPEGAARQIAKTDARRVDASNGQPGRMRSEFPVALLAEGLIDGKPEVWIRHLNGPKSRTTRGEAQNLADFAAALLRRTADSNDVIHPVVAYYGTSRLWGEQRLTAKRKGVGTAAPTEGYREALNSSSHYKIFAHWFAELFRMEFEERNHPERLAHVLPPKRCVQAAVDAVLRPTGWHSIRFATYKDGIVLEHPEEGLLPVDLLSDGIRTMIGLVGDLAHRAARLNPALGADAARLTPGIVLIDEIEMHLHPAWQQLVIGGLRAAFPAVQFVLTTHSPQVVSTVERRCVRLLSGDGEVHPLPGDFGTLGSESSRVLAEVFGVNPRPDSTEPVAWLREYLALVERGDGTGQQALALRAKLDETLGSSDPDLLMADMRMAQLRFLAGQ